MPSNNAYFKYLTDAYERALSLLSEQDREAAIEKFISESQLSDYLKTQVNQEDHIKIIPLEKTVANGIQIIISNILLKKNTYLYSILITCLTEKLVHPEQDIRYAQTKLPHGYSNRSVDQTYITPFLKQHGLTHSAASGAESGRNFERPEPFDFNHTGTPNGPGNREAFLGIIHAVQVDGFDPYPCIVLLMALDLAQKQVSHFNYPQPTGFTIRQIVDALDTHFEESKGVGRARLPVLAIQAIYHCLTQEMARYQGKTLRPINRHTANDKKGWIGDIQIDNPDSTPFEGVEVKSDKPIDIGMVLVLFQKFQGAAVDRYYILSTNPNYIAKDQETAVAEEVDKIRKQTGCEVIVNGLMRTVWYYLRLIADRDKFLNYYTQLLQDDLDVQPEHKQIWSKILTELEGQDEAPNYPA